MGQKQRTGPKWNICIGPQVNDFAHIYCQHPICNFIWLEADARREISSLHLLSAKMGDEWE